MNWQQILLSFDKYFYYLFRATAFAMTTAFYVIKTYQSVFERRMRTLQFRSPGIAPGNADESAPGESAEIMRRLGRNKSLVTRDLVSGRADRKSGRNR